MKKIKRGTRNVGTSLFSNGGSRNPKSDLKI